MWNGHRDVWTSPEDREEQKEGLSSEPGATGGTQEKTRSNHEVSWVMTVNRVKWPHSSICSFKGRVDR